MGWADAVGGKGRLIFLYSPSPMPGVILRSCVRCGRGCSRERLWSASSPRCLGCLSSGVCGTPETHRARMRHISWRPCAGGSAPGLYVTPHHKPCGDLRPQRLAPGTPQRDAPGDHAVWRRLRPARQDTEEGTQVRKPHLPQERQAVHVTRRLTDWRDLRPRAVHSRVHEGGHPFHHRLPMALQRLEERLRHIGMDSRGADACPASTRGAPAPCTPRTQEYILCD